MTSYSEENSTLLQRESMRRTCLMPSKAFVFLPSIDITLSIIPVLLFINSLSLPFLESSRTVLRLKKGEQYGLSIGIFDDLPDNLLCRVNRGIETKPSLKLYCSSSRPQLAIRISGRCYSPDGGKYVCVRGLDWFDDVLRQKFGTMRDRKSVV